MHAGFSVAQTLEYEHGIVAEMATDVLVLFMFGIGTSSEHVARLSDALAALAASAADVALRKQEHDHGAVAPAAASALVADCGLRRQNGLRHDGVDEGGCWSPELPAPEVALLPRDAFFAETERLNPCYLHQSAHR